MIDDNLKKSIQTKFYLGQGKDDELVLTKKTVSALSTGLTSIQNAFNQIKAYTGNVGKIQKAVIAARVSGKKESTLERSNVAPIETSGDQITNLFPQLTKGLEELKKSLADFEMGEGAGQQGMMSAASGGMGLLGKLAIGAGVAGIGYMALSSDEAEAATPPPPPPEPKDEPPKASEVSKQAEEKTQERKAQSEKSDARKAQKEVSQERQTDKLAQTVTKTANAPAPVTKQAAPPAASDWSSKLSDYIGKSVETVNQRVSSFQSMGPGGTGGGPGGDMGDGDVPTPGPGDRWIMDMVKDHEGVQNRPYKDSRGLWTVGVGHLIGNGRSLPPEWNRTFSDQEIDNLFAEDFAEHKAGAERGPGYQKANALGKGALIDLAFNMGTGWYKKWPQTSNALTNANWSEAADGLQNSAWYNQVGRRAPKIVGMIRRAGTNAPVPSPSDTSGGVGGPVATGPISRKGEAVQGMGFETAQAATRQMGIRGTNGNLDSGQLESIGVGSLKAAPPAARAMKAMRAAAAREGINIGVTDAYRDYATQVRLKQQKGKMAATPGRSNHGWGLAFDLSDAGKSLQNSSRAYKWLKANSERFGIFGPLASPYEIWHWEYRGGGSARPATVPVSDTGQLEQGPRLRSPAGGTINNAAIGTQRGECKCDEPTFIPVPVGGGAPSPTDYLKGMKPAQASRKYNVDTSEDYKIYFNAA